MRHHPLVAMERQLCKLRPATPSPTITLQAGDQTVTAAAADLVAVDILHALTLTRGSDGSPTAAASTSAGSV
jgi:hypothetical protein